ncbi:hypothetical protein MRX96_043420, partial [Rhipicephalus microplus]
AESRSPIICVALVLVLGTQEAHATKLKKLAKIAIIGASPGSKGDPGSRRIRPSRPPHPPRALRCPPLPFLFTAGMAGGTAGGTLDGKVAGDKTPANVPRQRLGARQGLSYSQEVSMPTQNETWDFRS